MTFSAISAEMWAPPPVQQPIIHGTATPGGTACLERAGVTVELYFPTDEDKETLAAALPGCDLDSPPWDRLQALLVGAGLFADWAGLTAPAVVAMVGKIRATPKGSPPGLNEGEGTADKATDSPAQDTSTATDEPLCERGQLVLLTLRRLAATDSDSRVTTAELCETAGVIEPVPYKMVVADLGRRGYVQTKRGAGGGVWLTKDGQERAAKL